MNNVDSDPSERIDLWFLTRDISLALTQGAGLLDCLRRCAEVLVRHLNVAFARIWTLNEDRDALELQACVGMYTDLDAPHRRIPLGQCEVGLIARDRKPYLTNQVVGDPLVNDQEWARREGIVAFAGYPLINDHHLVGVIALYSRHELAPSIPAALSAVAGIIASGIVHWTAVERHLAAVVKSSEAIVTRQCKSSRDVTESWNNSRILPRTI